MTGPRIRLTGGPYHTASSASIGEKGELIVEFHDFSDEAEKTFGNDIAFVLSVTPEAKGTVARLLEAGGDEQLLATIRDRFTSYFEVRDWLQSRSIPFTKSFDPWA
jgi:hypothetical protein